MKNLLCLFTLLVLTFCNDVENGVPCDSQNTQRIGAKCMDGTTSTATGSGACSSHGGVDYWICKNK